MKNKLQNPLVLKNVFHLDLGCNPQSHEMDSYASEAVFLVLLVTTPKLFKNPLTNKNVSRAFICSNDKTSTNFQNVFSL